MKILVAGQSGQIARSLMAATLPSGVQLVAMGRPDLDIRNIASVRAAMARYRPDVVINAAAYTQVDKAESDEAAAFALNAEGAAYLAQACTDEERPLIHLSTDFVFDGQSSQPYRETDPCSPLNAYGRSKLEGERQVAARCPRHLIVRTSWVYSPWGNNFLLTMLRLAETQAKIRVVDDQHSCPTYAPHLADALIAIARRVVKAPHDNPWGVVHAAGRGETTWAGLAQTIFTEAEAFGLPAAIVVPIPSADYPTSARRPIHSWLDNAKLHSVFGLTLPDWQVGVRECMDQVAYGRSIVSCH